MKVYTYCSYKSSPVGFQIGVFAYDKEKNENSYIPDTDKSLMNPFIISAFEDDRIDYVCYGKIPQEEAYLILLKKMKSESEDGIWKQLNLAFLFDASEYEQFLKMLVYLEVPQKYETNQSERKAHQNSMCRKLENLITLNPKDTETGISVPVSEMNEFMKQVDFHSPKQVKEHEKMYLIRFNEPEPLKEQPFFKFQKLYSDEITVKSKNAGMYVIKKKTPLLTEKNLILALNLLEILLLILILIKLYLT